MKNLIILSVLALLTGCASNLTIEKNDVVINTTPSNQNFTIYNEEGDKLTSATTPYTLTLSHNSALKDVSYIIDFDNPQFENVEFKANKKGWNISNIYPKGPINLIVISNNATWDLSTKPIQNVYNPTEIVSLTLNLPSENITSKITNEDKITFLRNSVTTSATQGTKKEFDAAWNAYLEAISPSDLSKLKQIKIQIYNSRNWE